MDTIKTEQNIMWYINEASLENDDCEVGDLFVT